MSPAGASVDGGPPAMLPEESIALEAASYAAEYGVPEEEAVRRLALMHDAEDSLNSVEQSVGDALGGIYFDNGADFALVVNTVGERANVPASFRSKGRPFPKRALSPGAVARGLTAARVERVRQIAAQPQSGKIRREAKAAMSRDKVQEIRQRNAQKNGDIEGYNGSSYDERSGEVVIRVFSKADRAKALESAQALYPGVPLRLQIDDTMPTLDHTRGGAHLTQGCTTGFVARDRTSNHVGVITAGHCNFSVARYDAPDGSNYDMVRRQWDMTPALDLAFFWDDHEPTSEFYPTSSATPRSLVGWTSVSDTEQRGYLRTGSYLCHYGVYSATQSCGEVTDKAFAPAVYNSQGTFIGCGKPGATVVACGPNFVRVDKVAKEGQVALQCIGGDSGGPWFAYGNAYGINKGGYRSTAGDKMTCQYAFYTPIIRINDINLTLWYGGTVVNGIAQ
jgi:hypothetical protein